VMVSKSGAALLDAAALTAVRERLLPLSHVVTPNIPEAEILTGMTIRTDDDRREAARRLVDLGAGAAIVKGGHLPTADIVDLLFDGTAFVEFRHERVPGRHTHGTGCTFAAAIAAHLAAGKSLAAAIPRAQDYIAGAIRHAPPIGQGHGPMQHFWQR
jgi:hydroxymethylpyrimidine kinase/phosphomethylpyrimidine kinase